MSFKSRMYVGLMLAVLLPVKTALPAQQGKIVGWGSTVIGVDLDSGFVSVAAGETHSLGLKADGSIVAWGNNAFGQCDVRAPNTSYVGVAAGRNHTLGLKANGSIVAWGSTYVYLGRKNGESWVTIG